MGCAQRTVTSQSRLIEQRTHVVVKAKISYALYLPTHSMVREMSQRALFKHTYLYGQELNMRT